jgi:hypothetical protein
MFIEVNDSEHATILAALRWYQQMAPDLPDDIRKIATNDGAVKRLSAAGIDELCERVNAGEPPVIGIGINVEGGLVECVFTDKEGVTIDCIKADWDTDGAGDDPGIVNCFDGEAFVGTEGVQVLPADMAEYRRARDARDAQEQS